MEIHNKNNWVMERDINIQVWSLEGNKYNTKKGMNQYGGPVSKWYVVKGMTKIGSKTILNGV